MARICLDARNITDVPCGVARYARGLIPELAVQAPDHDFVVLRHVSNREPITVAPNVREVFLTAKDDNVAHVAFGRRAIRATFVPHDPPDIYHSLFHLLPLGIPGSGRSRPRVVTTVHDLTWLNHPWGLATRLQGIGMRAYASFALRRSIRVADWVIAVSDATAQDIETVSPRQQVVTIHHGVAPEFFADPPPLPQPWHDLADAGQPFFIAVGSGKRYKNTSLLLRALAQAVQEGLRGRLVLVGPCAALAGEIAALGIADRTVLTGVVSDRALRALVGHAAMLVHPSRAEGFGLPVLEAMALGTPTAISDIVPLREVAGDAALVFDPDDVGALARILLRVSRDADLRQDLRQRGRRRASGFTWSAAARKTLDVYARVLGPGPLETSLV